MTSTDGMIMEYLTLKVDVTQKLSTWIKSLSRTFTMQSRRNALLENVTLDKDGKIDFA